MIVDPVPSESSIAALVSPSPPASSFTSTAPSPTTNSSTRPVTVGTHSEEPADQETEKLKALLAEGCGCKRAGGKPCSTLFSVEHFLSIRLQCAELTREELDFVLLGQIMATLSDGPHTTAEKHRHTATERKLTSMTFYHAGQRICGRTFQWLHGIGTLTSYINILLIATIQPPSFFHLRQRPFNGSQGQLHCQWAHHKTTKTATPSDTMPFPLLTFSMPLASCITMQKHMPSSCLVGFQGTSGMTCNYCLQVPPRR